MQRSIFIFIACALAAAGIAVAGESGSRAMSGWFNVTAENGWRGRRYMDGEHVFAEEFASGPSGRIDVWRFYRRGVLTSEERDVNGDGKVDLQTRWDPRNGLMTSVLRDTTRRGMNDLEIERTSHNRWEIREDRNLDGVTDRILYINAPNDVWDQLGVDLATQPDVTSLIPRELWRELWTDDSYSGSITDYYRYNNKGVLSYYGEYDGRKIAWRRCAPDFVPEPAVAASAPTVPLPAQAQARAERQPGVYVPPPVTDATPAEPGTVIRDPFDLSAGAQDADPYAFQPAPQPLAAAVPAPGPYDEGTAQLVEPEEPFAEQPRPAPRMDRLPTDESSARSVPARMRPPGTASRKPRPTRF